MIKSEIKILKLRRKRKTKLPPEPCNMLHRDTNLM